MFQERCQNIKYKSVLITTLFILFYFASLYLQPGVNVGVGGHAPLPPRPWIEQSLVQEPVKDRLLQEVQTGFDLKTDFFFRYNYENYETMKTPCISPARKNI